MKDSSREGNDPSKAASARQRSEPTIESPSSNLLLVTPFQPACKRGAMSDGTNGKTRNLNATVRPNDAMEERIKSKLCTAKGVKTIPKLRTLCADHPAATALSWILWPCTTRQSRLTFARNRVQSGRCHRKAWADQYKPKDIFNRTQTIALWRCTVGRVRLQISRDPFEPSDLCSKVAK